MRRPPPEGEGIGKPDAGKRRGRLTPLGATAMPMLDVLKPFVDSLPIDWLLAGEPFVRYRTLTDILGEPESDNEVAAARRAVSGYRPVKRILDGRNRDGYWGTPKDIHTWWPRKDTTFWVLGLLADLGLTREHETVARACEYVLGTQLPCGGFGWAPPPTPGDCYTGLLAESLAKLGYGADARLARAYEWLLQRQRLDGGFWCKNTGLPGGPREGEPSCAFATLCVLSALVQDPGRRDSRASRRCAEFLLTCWENRGKLKYAGHDSQIGKGWEKLKYPFTDYRVLRYVDTLSRLEFTGGDRRMVEIVQTLLAKRDAQGRFYPESVHQVWSDFDFGQKKLPSRWLTMLVGCIARRMAGRESPCTSAK